MLSEAIYSILSGDSDVSNNATVHNMNAPADTANPVVIFAIVNQDPLYTKDGAAVVVYTDLEIDIFVDGTPDMGYTIAGYVKAALDQYSGVVSGEDIDLIQWEGTEDRRVDLDKMEYQISMGFRIRTK